MISQNDPWDDAVWKIKKESLILLNGQYLNFLHLPSSVTEYLASASLPRDKDTKLPPITD